MYLFFPSLPIDIYFRNTLFENFIFVRQLIWWMWFWHVNYNFIFFKKKKKKDVNRQKFLLRRNAFLVTGLPWKLSWELLYLLPSKHLQREHVLSCAMCGLFSVYVLTASTKRCTSLHVWHQQHDKPCHLPCCFPCEPHLCITLSLRMGALWGRDCLLARAESSVVTY